MYGLSQLDLPDVETPCRQPTAWGEITLCGEVHGQYSLEHLFLQNGRELPFHFYLEREGTYYVEKGTVALFSYEKTGALQKIQLMQGHTHFFERGCVHRLYAHEDACVYLFSNGGSFQDARILQVHSTDLPELCKGNETFDRREKYWGAIETIVSTEYAGKRIFMRKGTQSSLEFHCRKTETYFVQSGLLKVGLRFSRAENKSILLSPGQSFTITPGMMHMRIALEDLVLIEISTKDDDRDSHLVEDGQRYEHKEMI